MSDFFNNNTYRDPSRKSMESRARSYDSTKIHEDDDVDSGILAHHHTLGEGPSQAISGAAHAALRKRVDDIENVDIATLMKRGAFVHRFRNSDGAAGGIPSGGSAPYSAFQSLTVEEASTIPCGATISSAGVITFNELGTYEITVGVNWQAQANARRIIFVMENGAVASGTNSYMRITDAAPSTSGSFLQWKTFPYTCLSVGNTLDFRLFQDSGVALTFLIQEGFQDSTGTDMSLFCGVVRRI